LVSSKTCSPPASLKLSQHLLLHVAAMLRAVTVIAMAVIVDAIVGAAVNAANAVSGQQAQLQMLAQTQKVHVKQNPVKKVVVVIAMVAPSALKSRAPTQML
jgi:hypothetical protein